MGWRDIFADEVRQAAGGGGRRWVAPTGVIALGSRRQNDEDGFANDASTAFAALSPLSALRLRWSERSSVAGRGGARWVVRGSVFEVFRCACMEAE